MSWHSPKFVLFLLYGAAFWTWHLHDLLKHFRAGWFYRNNLFVNRDAKFTRVEQPTAFWAFVSFRTLGAILMFAGLSVMMVRAQP